MTLTFDEKSPIYLQIAKQVKRKIISQELKSGDKLPTVRDYAQEVGVNPNTMQRAFTELEHEGMVYSKRTSGRYVTEDDALISKVRQEVAETEVEEFITTMTEIGFDTDKLANLLNDYIKEETQHD